MEIGRFVNKVGSTAGILTGFHMLT